ncbi:hypothetical protein FPV67DRAFT_1666033 [Lyophyllum atratum]|nr:hypothetical protein FPV67DRAFT_1666033 [Lyophyllum atratum]
MPPTTPHIPPEIIGSVIEELAGETLTLRRCTVVSSSFRDFAQAQLFCSITIHLDEELNQVNENLRAVLKNRPRIGVYVQSLVLRIGDVEETAIFSELLPTLTSVRSLNLIGRGDLEWVSLSSPFKAAFLQLLWLPTLSTLEVNFNNFPFPYLRFCTHLKHLTLLHRLYDNRLKIEDTPERELVPLLSPLGLPNQTTRQGHLVSLKMGNSLGLKQLLAVAQNAGSMLSLECIESFNGHVRQAEDFPEIQSLLALVRPSLRSLSFDVCLDETSSPRPTPSLQALPNLVRLQFSIEWMHAPGSSRWVCQVLEAIPSRNSIDTIIITARRLRNIKKVDWGRIDGLLTRERHHKSLRNVWIKVSEALEIPVLDAMPRLEEKGWVFLL